MRRTWLVLAALVGLVSVGMGAFGAHGVSDPRAQELLRTGALYGFVHGLATLFGADRSRLAPPLFLAGAAIFCGTLWAMALGGPPILGAITPIGGLSFMAGWLALGISAWRGKA